MGSFLGDVLARLRACEADGNIPARRILFAVIASMAVIVIAISGYLFLIPPNGFPSGQVISIPTGASVDEMGAVLKRAGVIRSITLFHDYARLVGDDRTLSPGDYVFAAPIGLAQVSHRIAHGEHGINATRVTLTEGMTAADMADTLAAAIPGFDTKTFIALAKLQEGYLFPDTYFFLPNATSSEVVDRLRSRSDEQLASIASQIAASGHTTSDVVIMASIIEREARTAEDRRIIAGILWKRLASGMPLQVDAAFGYVHGKNGYTPTQTDLASKTPYNTYLHTGLPPTPISNPGLDSLLAAVTPEKTAYLFYLTGRDGLMHYGRTFAEHKANRARYLD